MPLKNEKGEIIGTFGMSKDITESKNNEINLMKRTNLLHGLIENTPDSVFTIDTDYNLVLANERVKSLFRKAGVNLNVGDKVPGDGKWKSYYDRALAGESFAVEDNELNVKGEKKATYIHILGPVKDNEGKIIGASIITRNKQEDLVPEKGE